MKLTILTALTIAVLTTAAAAQSATRSFYNSSGHIFRVPY
jgi:hypothetical protein